MSKEAPSIAILLVAVLLAYIFGYASGVANGIEIGKDYSFEKVAKEAVKTAKEMLEIAEKLQKENDLLKQQLSQEQNQKQ